MKNSHLHAHHALVCLFLITTSPSHADSVPAIPMSPELEALRLQRSQEGLFIIPTEATRSPAELKMSSQLGSLFNAGLRTQGEDVAAVKAEMTRLGQIRSVPEHPDEMRVYVHATGPAGLAAVRPWLKDVTEPGATWPLVEWPMIAGWVREDQLATLALEPEVVFVEVVDPPRFRTGSVISAGDPLHNGPQVRGMPLNLDGSGMKVGVISDGVTSLVQAQGTLDLPAVNVLTTNTGIGDEGTAMLEIIHDLAPGAALEFCAAGPDKTSFGNAIAALHARGCNIICDDVGWYTDPFFQHSPLGMQIGGLQSLRDYLHVSAAGNDAQLHHQQVFTDVMPAGDGWHDPFLLVSIPNGGVLDVFMQWKEAQPVPPLTLASDYDLYLCDFTPTPPVILKFGTIRGTMGEKINYTNTTGATITAAVYVYRYSGTINHDVEIFIEPQNGAVQYLGNPVSAVNAIFGHPGYGSVLSVVSTDVTNPLAIEWDSSQGPFSILGTLQPMKPDLAAADGVAVSGAGGFPTSFFGTSAAAPHAAGVLALVWSRSPGVPAAALRNPPTLMQACFNLGTMGFDNVFGWGRPLADQWALLLNLPPAITTLSGVFNCAQLAPEDINGVTVSDPDAAANPISITFGVTSGAIFIDPNIPGGLTPAEISFNGSMSVSVIASQGAIQTTLSTPGGAVYLANPVPPGGTVADTLTLTVSDQGSSGIGGPLVAGGTVSLLDHHFAFDAWRYDHFNTMELGNPAISGDTANPDNDPYENQWEFFMGADPWSADTAISPTVTTNSGNLIFRFRISKEIPAGSPYAVRVSQDLVNWSDVPAGQITVPWPQHPTVADAWLMEVTRPLSANTTDFLRIRFNPKY